MVVLQRDDGTPAKKKEDLRDEIRKLETPHMTDVKSGMMDMFAAGFLGKGLSNRERLTNLRGACELALGELFLHGFVCKCEVPPGLRIDKETLEEMAEILNGITVPPLSYHDERNRPHSLIEAHWSMPAMGQQFDNSAQPERQPYLSERTQEDAAHTILNDKMLPAAQGMLIAIQVHGIIKFEEAEPAFDLSGILGKKPPAPLRPQLPAPLAAKLAERVKSLAPKPPEGAKAPPTAAHTPTPEKPEKGAAAA